MNATVESPLISRTGIVRTKVLATLGRERAYSSALGVPRREPVSYEQMIREFAAAGASGLRLNMSHASADGSSELGIIRGVRTVRAELIAHEQRRFALLADLQGPKLRIRSLAENFGQPIPVAPGDELVLGAVPRACERHFCVTYDGKPYSLDTIVRPKSRIWLGDGQVLLQVQEIELDGSLRCRVVHGDQIVPGRGVTVVGASPALECFTGKDRRDLELLLGAGEDVDFVALSFVRSAADVSRVKVWLSERLSERSVMPAIIVKVETPEAVADLDAILEVADGAMVARGDLALQVGLHHVPAIQKRVIAECRRLGKLVITATQMLESMIASILPTRAEVSDVWNAVCDGTDAVMLSGESALGQYPLQAIAEMQIIAAAAEEYLFRGGSTPFALPGAAALPGLDLAPGNAQHIAAIPPCPHSLAADLFSRLACELALEPGIAAIVTPTVSGRTARMASRHRPSAPILAAAHDERIARQLALYFGISPVSIGTGQTDCAAMIGAAIEAAKAVRVSSAGTGQSSGGAAIRSGDTVVVTAGDPLGRTGTTNLLKTVVVP